MGKFDFNFDYSLIRQISRIGNTDVICPAILNKAAPILEASIKKECRKHKRTGIMENSIKKSKAKKSPSGGYNVVVRPTGKRNEGNKEVRNMEIMAHIEYGTRDIKATPILTKALRESEQEITASMQQRFNDLVGGSN